MYFDDTVTVYDSFCIGHTYNNNLLTFSYAPVWPVETGWYSIYSVPSGFYEADTIGQRLWVISGSGDTNWRYTPKGPFFCGLFPIIDTTRSSAHEPDTGQGGGTTKIDPLVEQFTYLIPNPATDHTVICSSFPMRSVAIYDPAGRCVMQRHVDGTSLELRLSGYAKGCYHVVIQTSAGRTTKRLLVQ